LSQNNSDDEINYMTESQNTHRILHNKTEVQKDSRFGRNPNYSRITHASKQ